MKVWTRLWANRWFLLGLGFLIVNGVAVFRMPEMDTADESTSSVLFQAGDNGLISGGDAVIWKFSKPVISENEVGKWRVGCGPVKITPRVSGRFCWKNSRELIFEPDHPWRDCTAYTAKLPERMENGVGLEKCTFAFATAPLTVKGVVPLSIDERGRAKLKVVFSSQPSITMLPEHLFVYGRHNRRVSWKVAGGMGSSGITIKTEDLDGAHYRIVIKKGLPAATGNLGLKKTQTFKGQFESVLKLHGIKPEMDSFGAGRINVYLDRDPDFDGISQYVRISPRVDFSVEPLGRWSWESGFRIVGNFKPATAYTLTIKAGLRPEGGMAITHDIVRKVYFGDRKVGAVFDSDGCFLSSHGKLQVGVTSVNLNKLHVSVERIYPENIIRFALREADRYSGYHYWGSDGTASLLSEQLAEKDIAVHSRPNRASKTRLNMRSLMGRYASGAFLLKMSAEGIEPQRKLVVVSDLGIMAKRSQRDILVWVNSIADTTPLTNAAVTVYSDKNRVLVKGHSDRNGLFHAEINANKATPYLIIVKSGDDASYLQLDGTRISGGQKVDGAPFEPSHWQAYLFSDRGIYRPGETIHLKAVLRDRQLNMPGTIFPLELKIKRPDGIAFKRFTAPLSKWGTVAFDVVLPHYAMTGKYTLDLGIPGSGKTLDSLKLAVEDFVPPQIRVKATAPEGAVSGNTFHFNVHSEFLFGRAAAGLKATGRIEIEPVDFAPRGWGGYLFTDSERELNGINKSCGTVTLDKDGNGAFSYTIPDGLRPPSALRIIGGAVVREMSGRVVAGYVARKVDVYPYYLGIRRDRLGRVVKVEDSLSVSLAAVTPDGKSLSGEQGIRLELLKLNWNSVLSKTASGSYRYKSVCLRSSLVDKQVTLQDGRATYDFKVDSPGEYLLRIRAMEKGGSSASVKFYAGDAQDRWLSRSLDKPGQIELVPDKQRYRVGDIAHIAIKAPFSGRALLTVESDHVVTNSVFSLTGHGTVVDVPVTAGMLPNIYCSVNVIRAAKAEKIWRTHRAVGTLWLGVDMPDKRLKVELAAPQEIQPDGTLSVKLHVTDVTGQPIKSELTLAAVDEGICMLTGMVSPDALKYMLRKRRLGVEQYDLYSLLLPEPVDVISGDVSSPGGDAARALRRRLNPVNARRFHPLALWKHSVETDDDGSAEVSFDMPEFSGEVRLMAIAVAPAGMGASHRAIKVRRDVTVTQSLPRFLAPGDSIVMPVGVFNSTEEPRQVDVEIQCEGPISVERAKRSVTVQSRADKQLDFRLRAAPYKVGKALVTLKVHAGGEEYQQRVELAVRPASARVTRSGFGAVKAGETARINLPQGLMENTIEGVISSSARPSVAMRGALNYLLKYPYGCLEQTVSRAFPLLYLDSVTVNVLPGAIAHDEIKNQVDSCIARIFSMQKSDGSFSYWPGIDAAYRWGSVYAVNFLLEARKAGYDIDKGSLSAALGYIKKQLAGPVRGTPGSVGYGAEMRLRSYICYVLALAGDPDEGWMARLAELKNVDRATRINLAAALAASGRRRQAGDILRDISIDGQTGRVDYGCLTSPTRETAMMLMTWLNVNPNVPFVAPLAERLNKLRGGDGWFTTQDNAMAVLALSKYYEAVANRPVEFSAALGTEGDDGVKQYDFSDKEPLNISCRDLLSTSAIIMSNKGPGVAYYHWTCSGVPIKPDFKIVSHGIKIKREVLDIKGHKISGNCLRQGEPVVIKITLDTGHDNSARNLAVEDLLPAGLEIENTGLKLSQSVPWLKKAKHLIKPRYISKRDDRVVFFIDSLRGRKYLYYTARAVTRGEFVYPPIRCEGMYAPDVYAAAISMAGKLVVE